MAAVSESVKTNWYPSTWTVSVYDWLFAKSFAS